MKLVFWVLLEKSSSLNEAGNGMLGVKKTLRVRKDNVCRESAKRWPDFVIDYSANSNGKNGMMEKQDILKRIGGRMSVVRSILELKMCGSVLRDLTEVFPPAGVSGSFRS
ncbi:hypothetical protein [Sediminibacillus halophilus]|nr:hypothetical protein [Sediminibacillus halophilus]